MMEGVCLEPFFRNLINYCGIVATLFHGTSIVQSIFPVFHWEKDVFCQALSDFGMEGVMQTNQHLMIQTLL